MKISFFITLLLFSISNLSAGSWCKVVYNIKVSEGEIENQIKKCRNSDNFYLAIHSSYQNSGHLVNSFIAEYCDLRRQIVMTNPRKGDPFFTVVCEFRRNNLKE